MSDILLRFGELRLCPVCALRLPEKGEEGSVCSRRCASLRAMSRKILGEEREVWSVRILEELATLEKEATMCPGELSTRLRPDIEKPLTVFRPLIYQMAEDGRVRLSQKGVATPWWKIRGPFRIRKK